LLERVCGIVNRLLSCEVVRLGTYLTYYPRALQVSREILPGRLYFCCGDVTWDKLRVACKQHRAACFSIDEELVGEKQRTWDAPDCPAKRLKIFFSLYFIYQSSCICFRWSIVRFNPSRNALSPTPGGDTIPPRDYPPFLQPNRIKVATTNFHCLLGKQSKHGLAHPPSWFLILLWHSSQCRYTNPSARTLDL
jgi:hypothetical protein